MMDIIWYMGFFGILYHVWKFLANKAKSKVELEQFSYGWAVVTGGTDGIGKAMVTYLAKAHYKVIIVSRNEEKMEQLCSELKDTYGNPNIVWVQADFSKSYVNPKEFYGRLGEKLAQYEVSILINNVGVMAIKKFKDHTQEDFENMLGVNIYPQTHLMHHFTPIFVERFSRTLLRSCIINLSSRAGICPNP